MSDDRECGDDDIDREEDDVDDDEDEDEGDVVHPPFLASHCHLSTRRIGFLTTLQINLVSDAIRIRRGVLVVVESVKGGGGWFLCQPTD